MQIAEIVGNYVNIPAPVLVFIFSFLFVLILLKLFNILLPYFQPNRKFQLFLALIVAIYDTIWYLVQGYVRDIFYATLGIIPLIVIDVLIYIIKGLLLYYIIVKVVL